jgi:lactoylglutathione lyase
LYLKYVGIRVTDLERSVKFYTELLDLKEERRGNMKEIGGGFWVLLKDEQSGQRLELNWYPAESRFNVPYVPGESLDHIGFVVDDVRKTFNEFVAKGVEPTEITPDVTEGWVAHLKDPDGNWIEIFQLTEPKKET